MGVLAIATILALVAAVLLFAIKPAFLFGGEEQGSEEIYGVVLFLDSGPRTHKAEPGGSTDWGIRVASVANSPDTIEFSYEGGSLLQITLDRTNLPLAAGDEFVNAVRVHVPIATPLGSYDFTVYARSVTDPNAFHFVTLTVEVEDLEDRTVGFEDKVQCQYVLWIDGRTFHESSYEQEGTFKVSINPDNADATYLSVIPGFSEGIQGMKVGETKLVVVPPEKGYTDPSSPMYGKTLYFQIELVSIDTS